MKFSRVISMVLLALGGGTLAFFLFTGVLDYLYVSQLVGSLEGGLSEIEWANPYLGKAIISGVCVLGALGYWRYLAGSPAVFRPYIAAGMGVSTLCAFVLNSVCAITNWNHYFDAYGKSLRYYCITPDNHPHFFLKQRANPWTSEPLKPVTPAVIHDIEARLSAPFHEVADPADNDWFWPGDGMPRLSYSDRPDGSLHLFNALGYDPATSQELQPITAQVRDAYLNQRNAEKAVAEARQKEQLQLAENRRRQARQEMDQQLADSHRRQQAQEDADRAARRTRDQQQVRQHDRDVTSASHPADTASASAPAPNMAYVQPAPQYQSGVQQPPLVQLFGAILTGRLGHHNSGSFISTGTSSSSRGSGSHNHNNPTPVQGLPHAAKPSAPAPPPVAHAPVVVAAAPPNHGPVALPPVSSSTSHK